jgi:hypothetical protein
MHESASSGSFTVPHEFLESALHLYFERKAYSSALHLAGAAEELLGKLLRERDITPFLDSIQQLFMDVWDEMVSVLAVETIDGKPMSPKSIADGLNGARNHVKHSIAPATYDTRVEACWMLWRALSNYDGLRRNGAPHPGDSELMDRMHDECIEILLRERDG